MDNDKKASDKEPVTGEVSDKDLENVAGGVGGCAPSVAPVAPKTTSNRPTFEWK